MRPGEVLLTAQQVADRLNVSKKWVYEHYEKGELPGGKIGRHLRFREKEIDGYINRAFN